MFSFRFRLEMVSVEVFVARTRPLILLEKDAEVEKAKEEMQQATEASRCVRRHFCDQNLEFLVKWKHFVQSEMFRSGRWPFGSTFADACEEQFNFQVIERGSTITGAQIHSS